MTIPISDAAVEATAFAIFRTLRPSNMIDADWTNGTILGRDNEYRNQIMTAARAAIEAALPEILRAVGQLPDHALERLTTIGTVGWDDLFTLESAVSDAHTVYVIRHPTPGREGQDNG